MREADLPASPKIQHEEPLHLVVFNWAQVGLGLNLSQSGDPRAGRPGGMAPVPNNSQRGATVGWFPPGQQGVLQRAGRVSENRSLSSWPPRQRDKATITTAITSTAWLFSPVFFFNKTKPRQKTKVALALYMRTCSPKTTALPMPPRSMTSREPPPYQSADPNPAPDCKLDLILAGQPSH